MSTQRPFVQTCPEGQVLPHAPQFVGLFWRFAQTPEQSVSAPPPPGPPPPPAAGHVQRPPWQTCPPVQATPQAPQLLASFARVTHDEPQRSVPAAQEVWHAPAEHTWPAAQARPQAPQLSERFEVSTHTPPQSVWPVPHTHVPAEHD